MTILTILAALLILVALSTRLPVGTRSLLYGGHLWFLHPWFVAVAWFRLYGFRPTYDHCTGRDYSLRDPRLWVCFLVHDWGYWGQPDMDGEMGELHPHLGAIIVHWLFDWPRIQSHSGVQMIGGYPMEVWVGNYRWHDLVLYHSRFLSKRDRRHYSILCVADKLAISMTPWWINVPLFTLSGEIHEYRQLARGEKRYQRQDGATAREWYRNVQAYCREWSEVHKHGRTDTWTPERHA